MTIIIKTSFQFNILIQILSVLNVQPDIVHSPKYEHNPIFVCSKFTITINQLTCEIHLEIFLCGEKVDLIRMLVPSITGFES